MDLSKIITKYNNEMDMTLVELLKGLSESFGTFINNGVATLFAKDIIEKNKIIKPIYIKKDNNIYKFYCGENELFKVKEKVYDMFDTPSSALRCSLLPSTYVNYIFSNNQFEVGHNGLYEDYSKNQEYNNYRYLSIKSNGVVDYEAFVNKENFNMQKKYYSEDHEVIGDFLYKIKMKERQKEDYNKAIEKISMFFNKRYPQLSRDEYDRYFYDVADQYFYDIQLINKKEDYKDIYMLNGSSITLDKSDDFIVSGLSIKGKNNYNKENYLAITHPTKNDLKLLCVTDFVNGSRLHKKFQEIISVELEKWFLNLDAPKITDQAEIIKSLGKKIIAINSFITNRVERIKRNTQESRIRVIGSAIGLALITENDTYLINYGDTRIYVTKNEQFYPVTLDNTIVWDLYRKNQISKEEALRCQKGSVLTRYLGKKEGVPDLYKIKNIDYDKLFLFTDGVTDNLSDQTMSLIAQGNKGNEILRKIIIQAATTQARHDDVTGCCYIKK